MTNPMTICKACNVTNGGMINIFAHPNNLDFMYTFVSGINEINLTDALCVPCYDDLKIAYNFKQKCLQTDLIRRTNKKCPSPKEEEIPSISTKINTDVALNEQLESDNKTECLTTKFIFAASSSNVKGCDEEEIVISVAELSDSQHHSCDTSEVEAEIEMSGTSGSEKSVGCSKIEVAQAIFTCNDCGKTFNRPGNLRRHERMIHLQTNSSKCTKIRSKLSTSTKEALRDPSPNVSETTCKYCHHHFDSEEERICHENDHKAEEKPYRCTFENCSSQFKERFGLRKHLEIHSNVKKFKCNYCEQRFHQRGNALSHERVHSGEKPFVCHRCGKAFAESGNLKAHIRFHTGERPYVCPECPKRFTTHYSHKIHIRSHTKEKPYHCECGKHFSSSGKLLVHKRIHSGYRPYKCDVCEAAFVDSSGLKRHTKIH